MMRSVIVILIALTATARVPALAQTYPVKPVRLINAFAPGGASDVVVRRYCALPEAQRDEDLVAMVERLRVYQAK